MKKIFICPNTTKAGMKQTVSQILPLLTKMGFHIIMDPKNTCLPDDISRIQLLPYNEAIASCECILVIGGDGTILRIALAAARANKPVLGINKGTLGFIPELEVSEIPMMESLLTGDFQFDNRMLLDISVVSDTGKEVFKSTALNEVSVSKGTLSKMIGISVFVNGKKTISFSGDGLIVCTPTGSTAYSLAAGGPILEPSCSCMAVTPICPHAINVKSFVLDAERSIEVRAEPGDNSAFVFADGSIPVQLSPNDVIKISRSKLTLSLVRIKDLGFYEIIRKKLSKERA